MYYLSMKTDTGLENNANNAPARRTSYAATGRERNRIMAQTHRELSDALEQYIDAHTNHGCGVQNTLDADGGKITVTASAPCPSPDGIWSAQDQRDRDTAPGV